MTVPKLAALAALVVSLSPAAARADEQVFLFRTEEDPSVQPECQPGDTVLLGALLSVPRTRARDGLVTVDPGPVIGTAIGCGKLLTYTPFDPVVQSPFAMKFDFRGRTITAKGTCTITSLSFPIPGVPAPLLLVGCTLDVNPDPAHGILRGAATSSSVFTPRPIPGYGTGSFWTVHLYLAD